MAFDRHTLFGGALVGVIILACIGGLMITGGPGDARKQKEDNARLYAISETVQALACYYQVRGDIPEDLSEVEKEFSGKKSDVRQLKGCAMVQWLNDPVSDDPFRLLREDGEVTHLCATFASTGKPQSEYRYRDARPIMPGILEAREAPGEHCYELNLDAELD